MLINLIFRASINLAGERYLSHEMSKSGAKEKSRKCAPKRVRPQLRIGKMAISVIQ